MMLINPRTVERDNQNALRKFPLCDAATCTNGVSVIVPGAIIDAQLYIPGRTPGPVWMSAVGEDGKLRFSDDDGVFAETAYAMAANTPVPVVYTGTGNRIPGGVIVFGKEEDVAALRTICGQEFEKDQTELAPAVLAWPGLPGVIGFLLDDGNTVFGDVRIRGENGCEVSTYENDKGEKRLRISAVGNTVETVEATGYITRIVAESNNRSFIVSQTRSEHVVDVQATGVSTLQDEKLNADQENVCAAVKNAIGKKVSPAIAGCEEYVCKDDIIPAHKITLMDGLDVIGNTPIVVFEGSDLGTLDEAHMPKDARHPGKRFAGYYDGPETTGTLSGLRLYYRFDGKGTGLFTKQEDVTLYAHWIPAASRAEVTFASYGTLHLAAPDLLGYANPIVISGITDPIPTVKETSDDVLAKGGAEALPDVILHPDVPAGTVTIGIRGLEKTYAP